MNSPYFTAKDATANGQPLGSCSTAIPFFFGMLCYTLNTKFFFIFLAAKSLNSQRSPLVKVMLLSVVAATEDTHEIFVPNMNGYVRREGSLTLPTLLPDML